MKDYKKDDTVWFIHHGHLLVIECKVTDVDDFFRKKDPRAYLFYWLDEPVGHAAAADELFDSKEEALKQLKINYEELLKEFPDSVKLTSLSDYREKQIKFIIGTHYSKEQKQEFKDRIKKEEEEWHNSLSDKNYGEKWFNYQSIK